MPDRRRSRIHPVSVPVLAACLVALLAAPAAYAQRGADGDRDGVPDHRDNCSTVVNPAQLNTDRDEFGNACDPDFDQNGRVGISDFNALRAGFGLREGDPGFDAAVDLNGDGGIGIADFNTLRAYFGRFPGPGAVDAPPGPTCDDAKDAARTLCCGEFPLDDIETDTVLVPTDCDCSGGQCVPADFIAQACLPAASVSNPPQLSQLECPPPEKLADENGEGGDPICLDALDDAKEACGLAQNEFLDLLDQQAGDVVELLPVCEALESWVDAFTCDPLRKWRRRPFFTPAEQAEFDGKFTLEPEQSGWFPPPPKQDPPDPAIPLSFPFPSPDAANEPVRVIRAEVPGNLLRFWLENAAVKPILQEIDTQMGVDCSLPGLSCDFDVLNMKDLSEDIEQDFDEGGEGVRFEVDKTQDGYEIHDLQFVGLDPSGIDLTATFTGSISISSEGSLAFDLDDRAFLRLLPLHDPKGDNGYGTSLGWPDPQVSYLDRVVLYTELTDLECDAANALVLENQLVNGRYYTFSTPYRCRCDPIQGSPTNYCVADPYARPLYVFHDGALSLGANLIGNEAHYVYCSAKDPLGQDPNTTDAATLMVNLEELPAAVGPDLETLETEIGDFGPVNGLSGPALGAAIEDIRAFGCNGQYATRLPSGEQINIDLGSVSAQFGRKVSSAFAVEAAAEVETPTIVSEVNPGLILLDFDMGAEMQMWFEENWWSFPLGWLLQWVLEIFSAIASILSTFLVNLIEPVSTIEFGDLEVLIHAMVSHRNALMEVPDGTGLRVVTPELGLGVRRLASNIPTIDVTAFELAPDFDADSCDLTNPESFVDWALALFLCPLELASNLAKFAATPLIIAIKGLGELLVDVFVAPQELLFDQFASNAEVLEEASPLAGLVASAAQTVSLLPYYLEPGGNPANAPAALGVDLSGLTPAEAARRLGGSLPPPFSQLCLGSNATSVNCFLAKLFLGSANPRSPQLDLLRLGAKTHYRSFEDITGTVIPVTEQDYQDEGLSWDYPPVRYCVQGDTPPASTNYTSLMLALNSTSDYLSFGGTALLEQLSDLGEIEVSSDGDPTPTDWRAQCAAFADFRITTEYFIRRLPDPTSPRNFLDVELLVQPTKRSNFLLDEVFFCENDASCDPTSAPFRARAELAVCSFLADVWLRVCELPACADDPPYDNVLQMIQGSPTAQALVVAAFQGLASQVGDPAMAAQLAGIGTRLDACVDDLEDEGYVIPETLVVAP